MDLEKKLEFASQKRDEQLEQVKNIAHMSAEKKHKTNTMGGAASGFAPTSAYTAYDE